MSKTKFTTVKVSKDIHQDLMDYKKRKNLRSAGEAIHNLLDWET